VTGLPDGLCVEFPAGLCTRQITPQACCARTRLVVKTVALPLLARGSAQSIQVIGMIIARSGPAMPACSLHTDRGTQPNKPDLTMFIAVEGITGIGKSTLQRILCERYGAEPLIQEFENHPYMAGSDLEYRNDALEREAIFLFMAYHQLKLVSVQKTLVSDFVFDKLTAFARTVLAPDELDQLYMPCFHYLCNRVEQPRLVIWLSGSPSYAIGNIRRRGRPGELFLTEADLARQAEAFERLFRQYACCEIIHFDAERNSILENVDALESLFAKIEAALPELRQPRALQHPVAPPGAG
jgi:deoxyguanosine kinase